MSIGEACIVKSMVNLGATLGDRSVVTKLSVVEEGVIVPEGAVASGNPACRDASGVAEQVEPFGCLFELRGCFFSCICSMVLCWWAGFCGKIVCHRAGGTRLCCTGF
uniref:Uncharacterized protein n=1 Tax=Cyclophora tenuis TaxID=216820 RepID=A0A7S1D3Z9_CYCTE|mmetsp:Transcript_22197/g.37786  ORF Transcript_22197/g.37786 Transcript_22197/m.37786 type:complete len:107 (+) Transcript_22197:875-1195(+)